MSECVKRIGPLLTIAASCDGCAYEHSESYVCQGDSGFRVFCIYLVAYPVGHPDGGKARRVGDTTWQTPTWCPLLAAAKAALLAGQEVAS